VPNKIKKENINNNQREKIQTIRYEQQGPKTVVNKCFPKGILISAQHLVPAVSHKLHRMHIETCAIELSKLSVIEQFA